VTKRVVLIMVLASWRWWKAGNLVRMKRIYERKVGNSSIAFG